MKGQSPTSRSLEHLRELGYVAAKVEQRLPIPQAYGTYITRDMFGFADIVATNGKLILAVQATTTKNLSAHETKANGIDALRLWLDAGGKFELHGWSKKGKRGERKLWTLTIRTVT